MTTGNGDRHVRLIVSGRVQGVSFRANARRQGERLGLQLTARNQDDGTVLIEASGPSDGIDALIDWAHSGPPAASVESVDITADDQQSRGFA